MSALTDAEKTIHYARRAGDIRRQEQERVMSELYQVLYSAKEQETIDAVVRIAQVVLDPQKP